MVPVAFIDAVNIQFGEFLGLVIIGADEIRF